MTTTYKIANNSTNANYIQIKNNKSGSNGGGVAVDSNAVFSFTIGYIQNNEAVYGGGVAVINTLSTESSRGSFTTNSSGQYQNYIINNTANNGGAIAVVSGTATTKNIIIYNNTAINGGAIYVAGEYVAGANTKIGNESSNVGNIASSNGGGIYVAPTGTVTQSEGALYITVNEATGGEGGAICNLGVVTFSLSTSIYNNRAFTGGGIANLDSGTLNIAADGKIYKNTATGDTYGGGGLYNVGTVKITANYTFGGTSITNGNTAVRGGGIYTQGTFIIGDKDTKLTFGLGISYNKAELFGGGLFVGGGTFADYSCGVTSISSNQQTLNAGGGGGICISDGSFVSKYYNYRNEANTAIENSSCWFYVQNNSTAGAGGGILVSGSSGTSTSGGVILNGARIYQNSAIRGGGIAVQAGIVKIGDYNNGQRTQCLSTSNSASYGGSMFLQTPIYIYNDLSTAYGGASSWTEGIYLANARAYLIFGKKTDDVSFKPDFSDYHLVIKVNSYDDGRRIAKFSSYTKEVEISGEGGTVETLEYQTTFAEDYFKKFTCDVGNNYGISYDDNGYVILAEPVAYNLTKGTYSSTLATAADQASSGDYIQILKSHTVSEQVLIVDKSINFVINADLILTRGTKLNVDMFRGFTTKTSTAYSINFNPYYEKDGIKYGNNVTLTIDGNKNNPTLLASRNVNRGSIIGVSGGLYGLTDGKVSGLRYSNAGYSYGMGTAGSGYYLNGSLVDADLYGNWGIYPASMSLSVRKVDFVNNASYQTGGAITYRGYTPTSGNVASTLSLADCNFTNNETLFYGYNVESMYNSGTGGGAVFAMGGKLAISGCNFDGNISASSGGAIVSYLQQGYGTNTGTNYGYSLSYTPINISETFFSNNKALDGQGGALKIVQHDDGYSSFTLNTTVNFYGNTASKEGGAIYRIAGYYKYQDIINIGAVYGNVIDIINNTAYTDRSGTNGLKNKDSATTYVPTNVNYSSRMTLSGSTVFEGNSATGRGGAVYDYNNLYITNESVKFDGNTSGSDGGAIYAKYFTNIKGVTCLNNNAAGNGGAIYIYSSPTVFAKTSLTNNSAGVYGGGVYFYSTSKLGIEGTSIGSSYNNYITYNSAGSDGGGVYFRVSGNHIYGGTYSYNKSGGYGGGIAAVYSSSSLGVYIYGAEDISNNQASLRGGGVYSWGRLKIVGTDAGGTNISNNVITDAGNMSGGGGVWSFWEIYLTGTINFLNNQITATNVGTNSGGGAIFAYSDEIYLTHGYRTNSSSYSITDPGSLLFRGQSDQNTSMPNTTGNHYTYASATVGSTTIPYVYFYGSGSSGTYFYPATYANITISGNSAGVSSGDGIYYWGSSLYVSGNIQMEDDIYMHNGTSSVITMDNYLLPNQNPYKVTYGANPTVGYTMVTVMPGINLTQTKAAMFNVTNTNYYVELESGSSYNTTENVSTYTNSIRNLVFRTGTVTVVLERSLADELIKGSSNAPQADLNMSYGDSLSLLYKEVQPARPGYNFEGFNLLDGSGGNVIAQYTIGGIISLQTKGSQWTDQGDGVYRTYGSTAYGTGITKSNCYKIVVSSAGYVSMKYKISSTSGTYNSYSYGRLCYTIYNEDGTYYSWNYPNYYYNSWRTFGCYLRAGQTLYIYMYKNSSSYNYNYLEIKDISDKDSVEYGDNWSDMGTYYKTSTRTTAAATSVEDANKFTINSNASGSVTFSYRFVNNGSGTNSSYGYLYYIRNYNSGGYTTGAVGYNYSWTTSSIYLNSGDTLILYFYASSATANHLEIKDLVTPSEKTVKSFPLLPSKDTLRSLLGYDAETITMTCIWKAESYTLWVHKYILDTGSVYGSLSTKAGEYSKAYSTDNSYVYSINSNETFEAIVNDLENSASSVDTSVKKDYMLGYTKVGYMLSYDRKYYTATSRYPYSFGYDKTGSTTSGKTSTDLYIVYKTAEYTLTFNADDDSELLTENNEFKVKYERYTSLMSANMIYRKGYTLGGWLGSDGNEYFAPGGKDAIKKTYEIISGSTSYPWVQEGDTWKSSNQGVSNSTSSMYIKILESGYISFDYKSYGENGYDYLIVFKNSSQVMSRSGASSVSFFTYSMQVTAGDTIEFRYRKDGSVNSFEDSAYIKNLSGSSKQLSYTFTSDMSFTPIWVAIPFDVRVYYNYPDGGTSFKLYSITAGSNILESLNENPVTNPEGYTLKGYSYSSDVSSELLESYELMPGEDLVLYAQWQAETVIIKYYDSDWVLIHEQEALFGTEIQLFEYDGISIWQNYGDKMLYVPNSSFLITNKGQYYLQFTPQGL